MSLKQRRDHRPDPDHIPAPVFCLVCDEELKRVWDPKTNDYYWRHNRRWGRRPDAHVAR